MSIFIMPSIIITGRHKIKFLFIFQYTKLSLQATNNFTIMIPLFLQIRYHIL